MATSRRKFITGTAGIGLGAVAVAAVAACTKEDTAAPSPSTSTLAPATTKPPKMITAAETQTEFEGYLQQQGLTESPTQPLISGIEFNGGLRYDDDPSTLTNANYLKQTAARPEDVEKKDNPGTLPIFTLMGVSTTTPEQSVVATDLIMTYLTGTVGLDMDRLRVTTTDRSSQFFPQLDRYGISSSQITLRPWDEAVADGSGSGFFAPAGHPGNPAVPSFSIEYMLSSGARLELAEITYGDGTVPTAGGIGVERVSMARNDVVTSWADSLPAFKSAVEESVAATGAARPAGYYAILEQKQP
jgi:hypothetical protein